MYNVHSRVSAPSVVFNFKISYYYIIVDFDQTIINILLYFNNKVGIYLIFYLILNSI